MRDGCLRSWEKYDDQTDRRPENDRRYIEAKKPKTLAEAEYMLDLISVMADETILDEDTAESSLAKRLISKPFFP
jgi:hypothetical protein